MSSTLDEPTRQTSELIPGIDQIDPIWTTSRSSRQIYALSDVDKNIGKLLSCASSALELLALPQTDSEGSTLPQGEERSEQFVAEVTEYFEKLDQIHTDIRFTLAHMRQARIVPSAIDAPPPNFVPRASGVGTPAKNASAPQSTSAEGQNTTSDLRYSKEEEAEPRRGLQEERVNRDAWRGVVSALQRLRDAQQRERDLQSSKSAVNGTNTNAGDSSYVQSGTNETETTG